MPIECVQSRQAACAPTPSSKKKAKQYVNMRAFASLQTRLPHTPRARILTVTKLASWLSFLFFFQQNCAMFNVNVGCWIAHSAQQPPHSPLPKCISAAGSHCRLLPAAYAACSHFTTYRKYSSSGVLGRPSVAGYFKFKIACS